MKDVRLQSIAQMETLPMDDDPLPIELDGSMEQLDDETRTVAELDIPPEEIRRRYGRFFRPQSFVSSTTLTTTSVM